jgi:hypothetical protein
MVMRPDAIVARLSQGPEYREALNRWLTPDAIKRHGKELNDFYRKRALPTNPAEFALAPASPTRP